MLPQPEITASASPEALQTAEGMSTLRVSVTHSAGGYMKWWRYDYSTWTYGDYDGESPLDATGTSSYEAKVEPGGSSFLAEYYPPGRDEPVSRQYVSVSAPSDTSIHASLSPT